MIDLKQFALLHKKSSKSFHQQKALIKQVMAGKAIDCPECGTRLRLTLPTGSNSNVATGIKCEKGCTDILLDFGS